MLLEELRSEFILDCRIRNLSERTVETYELNISLFLRWLEKEMKVNELSPLNKNHFKMYVVHLQREQYQASYINLLMKCLKSFFNYLVEEEYVSVSYPKQIKVLRRAKGDRYLLRQAGKGINTLLQQNRLFECKKQVDRYVVCRHRYTMHRATTDQNRPCLNFMGRKINGVSYLSVHLYRSNC